MKKVILALAAFTTVAATAATVRLGSATIHGDDQDVTLDVRKGAPVVSSVTLAVKGETVRFSEVRVVYRTGDGNGPYKSSLFRVNRVVQNGGAITLDLPDNGYPVRRIEIEGEGVGFNRDAYITAYGSN